MINTTGAAIQGGEKYTPDGYATRKVGDLHAASLELLRYVWPAAFVGVCLLATRIESGSLPKSALRSMTVWDAAAAYLAACDEEESAGA